MALPLQFALHASPRSFVTAQGLRRQAVWAPNTERARIMDLVGFCFLIVLAPLIVYAVAFWRGIAERAVPALHAPAPKLKRSHHKKRRAY